MSLYISIILFPLCVIILPMLAAFTYWNSPNQVMMKSTAFECGFDPMSKFRMSFSLRFFMLIVIFLIFDIEVALLFPFLTKIINMSSNPNMIVNLLIFLFTLLMGLIFEWKEGSLNWLSVF